MSTQEIEIKVPQLGESISEAFVGEWYVKEGAYVAPTAKSWDWKQTKPRSIFRRRSVVLSAEF